MSTEFLSCNMKELWRQTSEDCAAMQVKCGVNGTEPYARKMGKVSHRMCACSDPSSVSDSLQPQGLQPATLLCPWDDLSKNTGVAWHFLLQVDLPDPNIESMFSVCPLAGRAFTAELPGKTPCCACMLSQ